MDDSALKRFVIKHFPPGTDIYAPKVFKKLSDEWARLTGANEK